MPAYPDWETTWPEQDYTVPLGNIGFIDSEPQPDKPKHPIGFQVPALDGKRRPNKPAAKSKGAAKKPRKRERT